MPKPAVVNKNTVLAVSALLLVTCANAVEWQAPDPGSNDVLSDGILLEATDSNSNSVKFGWRDDGESGQFNNVSKDNSSTWSSGLTGRYELKASDENNPSDQDVQTRDIDNSGPTLDDSETFPSPGESISDERPDIELRFDDSPAGVDGDSVDASFQDSDIDLDKTDETDGDGGGATFEPDEDLSSEESYTVGWDADDSVGNTGADEFDFTVDSGYNGPSGVSLEPEDGNVIGLDDDEFQLDITVDENDDGDTEIEVGCYQDSDFDDEYDTGTIDDSGDNDEDDRTFTCDIDVSEYDDGDTIYIGLADQAGNRYSDDTAK
jgi:hypothetical protein